jgi:cysteine-rich repeat protein
VLAGTGSIENPPPTVPGVFVFAPCGDETLNPGEECDDGNVATGDGCTDRCSHDSTPTTTSSSTTSTSTSTSTSTLPPNNPPIALVPSSYLAAVGQEVVLDGSASFDLERAPLGYSWTLAETPAASQAVLAGPTSATPRLTADVAGLYRIGLVVNDGFADSASATTTVAASAAGSGVQLAITEPADGAALTGAEVLVRGTVQGSPSVGVTVNGVVAGVQGTSFAAKVPVRAGPNAIVATAAVVDGEAARDEIVVEATVAPQELLLRVRVGSGVVPVPATFEFVRSSAVDVQTIAMDYDGDGTDDVVTADPNLPLHTTYATAGLYVPRLRITDVGGHVSHAFVVVAAQDPTAMDAMFIGLWNGMLLRLAAGDRSGAEAFLDVGARAKYGPVFATLAPELASIVATFPPLRGRAIGDRLAEYFVRRVVNGEARVFFVYFLLGRDGVWRISAM